MKKWILSLMVPFALGAFAAENSAVKLYKYELSGGFWGGMSDNGLWAVYAPESNGEQDAFPWVANLTTGEFKAFPLNDPAQRPGGGDDGFTPIARCNDITDDGKIIVGSYCDQAAYYKDGEWISLKQPAAYRRLPGEVIMTSPDGKYMVGWVSNSSWTEFTGALWVDGKLDTREWNLPTYEDMYKRHIIDSTTLNEYMKEDGTYPSPCFMFHQISPDGKYMIVSIDRHKPNWGSSVILYNLEDNTYDWFLPTDITGQGGYVHSAMMSPDGKQIIATGSVYVGNDDVSRTFKYDPVTKECTPMPMAGELVDNNGNLYAEIGRTMDMNLGKFSAAVGNLWVPMETMLVQKYGVDFAKETGYASSGFAMAISGDGKAAVGMSFIRTSGWSIQLDRNIKEASEDVNLLSSYAVSIPEGSKLAKFAQVAVQVSYQAEYNSEIKPVIRKGDEVVAQANSVEPVSSNKTTYLINFPETQFEKDVTYTMELPEGTFYVPGSSSKTRKIEVNYVGRELAPVKPAKISPEENTPVKEFTAASPLIIEFDNQIIATGTKGVIAELYEEGNPYALSQMIANVSGKLLSLYPTSAPSLVKGKKYEVRVPAAIVSDIAGFCHNEAFTLKYEGLFERLNQLNGFSEDFSNPATALNSFLLYEGDHNVPTDEMKSLGFDQHNTPWNFSVRDDGNMDYCAASHSTYNPSGKSDDWMVIPQLTLAKGAKLRFDLQSLRSGKNDKLKVIIYEDSEVYNALSTAVVNQMKSEGREIFNGQAFPGTADATLTGDWTPVEIDLAEFVGKPVYIAFVNENENQSMVFVDNVSVKADQNYEVYTNILDSYVGQEDLEAKIIVKNTSETSTFNKLTATLKNLTSGWEKTYEADINLAKGQEHEFIFPDKMPLEKGKISTIQLDINLDGEEFTQTQRVKNIAEKLDKKVLIEEGTGAWCGNCPKGVLALEYIMENHPDKMIPVAVHNRDNYAMEGYISFLGITGYPGGRVNRGPLAGPMTEGYKYVSESQSETFYDYFLKEMNEPVELAVSVTKPSISTVDGKLQYVAKLDFALDRENVNYNILSILVEDDLPLVQENYLYQNEDPIFGKWGANGEYGQQGSKAKCYVNHVARGIGGYSYNGESGLIPRNVEAGTSYEAPIRFDLPKFPADYRQVDLSKASIISVIIDAATGEVINADIAHNIVESDEVGIDSVTDGAQAISLRVVNGQVLANGSADVEVYNLQGARVENAGLKGIYIVRAVDAEGNVRTEKISVR